MEKRSLGQRIGDRYDRKLPGGRGRPARLRRAPKWMPLALAELYAWLAAGTILGPFSSRLLTLDECSAARSLYDSVDPRGEWFGATWHPFLEDDSGNVTCVDAADETSGAVIYVEKHHAPQRVATSTTAYLLLVEKALAKLPDPPSPDEDDYDEEEQLARFHDALKKVLAKSTRPAARPSPQKDVPKAPPPFDRSVPRALTWIASLAELRKRALAAVTVGDGLDSAFGRGWRFLLIGGANGRIRLLFARGPFDHPERAAFVFLDRRARDALITLDKYPHHETIVSQLLEALAKLGLRLTLIAAERVPSRQVARWQKFLGEHPSC